MHVPKCYYLQHSGARVCQNPIIYSMLEPQDADILLFARHSIRLFVVPSQYWADVKEGSRVLNERFDDQGKNGKTIGVNRMTRELARWGLGTNPALSIPPGTSRTAVI